MHDYYFKKKLEKNGYFITFFKEKMKIIPITILFGLCILSIGRQVAFPIFIANFVGLQ